MYNQSFLAIAKVILFRFCRDKNYQTTCIYSLLRHSKCAPSISLYIQTVWISLNCFFLVAFAEHKSQRSTDMKLIIFPLRLSLVQLCPSVLLLFFVVVQANIMEMILLFAHFTCCNVQNHKTQKESFSSAISMKTFLRIYGASNQMNTIVGIQFFVSFSPL